MTSHSLVARHCVVGLGPSRMSFVAQLFLAWVTQAEDWVEAG
jgi:hypothetical protein